MNRRQGLVLVNTGNGKGKTTAALGTLFRAWGRGLHVGVIQFIKAETANWGEIRAARQLKIEWRAMGDGFTWQSKDLNKTTEKIFKEWTFAQAQILTGSFDVLVLDEMTYAFRDDVLEVNQVIAWLKAHKPPEMHLIITGRDAPPELIEYADLVTEMREIKHPYARGIKAQPGIEF